MSSVFWALLALGIYPYLAYPVLVALAAKILKRSVHCDDGFLPEVTIVIAAYNEEKSIESTIQNKLEQDYPQNLLSLIVVSDESSDSTDLKLKDLASMTTRLAVLRQSPRQGKTSALNLAAEQVTSEIIVFADANSLYAPDAVRKMVRNFADKDVGYVTGKMTYVNKDGVLVGDGCDAFMRYENWLRGKETLCGSIVGSDGGVDAIRRSLYRPMRPDQLPDFVLPLAVVEQGRRVVFESEAMLHEESLSTDAAEFRMRVRVALRAFWALWDMRGLMNPFRFGLFSWQLLSHKVLRYLSFLPLALAAVLNWFLLSHGLIYSILAVGQICVIAVCALAAQGMGGVRNFRIVRFSFYFLLINLSSAFAFVRFLMGEKQVIWKPRSG